MKFLRRDQENFLVEFEPGEKKLLLHLLSLYPLVPESYHRVTKDKHLPHRADAQQLLDEDLKSQRAEHTREILALLKSTDRFVEKEHASTIAFSRADLEWLLQVVNDIRVGCWLALGSPGYDKKKIVPKDKETMRQAMFVEIAGGFQMFFLGIIHGDVPPESAE